MNETTTIKTEDYQQLMRIIEKVPSLIEENNDLKAQIKVLKEKAEPVESDVDLSELENMLLEVQKEVPIENSMEEYSFNNKVEG